MATNKVMYGDQTIIDLTQDTATVSDVASGKTFHDATGAIRVGTASGGSTNVYGMFVDPTNVIVPYTEFYSTLSYTATEDCYIGLYVVTPSNSGVTVKIDNVLMYEFYINNTIEGEGNLIPLKKGQTLSVVGAHSNYESYYIAYGVIQGTNLLDAHATLLWEGNFSADGTIQVPHLSDYLVIAVQNDVSVLMFGNQFTGTGSIGIYGQSQIGDFAYRFNTSVANELTIDSNNQGIIYNYGSTYRGSSWTTITKIYGLIKKASNTEDGQSRLITTRIFTGKESEYFTDDSNTPVEFDIKTQDSGFSTYLSTLDNKTFTVLRDFYGIVTYGIQQDPNRSSGNTPNCSFYVNGEKMFRCEAPSSTSGSSSIGTAYVTLFAGDTFFWGSDNSNGYPVRLGQVDIFEGMDLSNYTKPSF